MRPYYALIVDSFREAFASRVLWIVLVLVAIVLLALSPIGYQPVLSTEFASNDIWSVQRLVNQLNGTPDSPASPAAAALLAAADRSDQQMIREAASGVLPHSRQLRDMLNDLLEREDQWYQPALWESLERRRELRELEAVAESSLSDAQRRRRARLRIEAALGALTPRPTQSVVVTYAGFEFPFEIPVSPEQFKDLVERQVVPPVLQIFLGAFAVFVAILVTAPIIPSMFQTGTLQLLLSKPVSRPLMFLTKFVGGCAFILVTVSPLVIGVWLILGFRIGVWNHRLLLAIPLFCFLFAFYYSVSAVAGLIWRNTVVSIVVTVLFWGLCFLVATVHSTFYVFGSLPNQAARLLAVEDDVHMVTTRGRWKRVDWQDGAWQLLSDAQPVGPPVQIYGPIALAQRRVAMATGLGGQRFGGNNLTLQVTTPETAGEVEQGAALPPATVSIHAVAEDDCLAATRDALMRLPGSQAVAAQDRSELGGFAGVMRLLGGLTNPGFRDVTPKGLALGPPLSVATAERDDRVAVLSGQTLYRLRWDSSAETYSVAGESPVEGKATEANALAMAGETVALVREDQPLDLFRFGSGTVQRVELPEEFDPYAIQGDPGSDRFAIVSSDGIVLIVDASSGRVSAPDIPHQGEIHATCWDDQGRLWTAHHLDFLTLVDVDSGAVLRSFEPAFDQWRYAMHYAVDPIYTVFPKPGELGSTMQSLIFDTDEAELEPERESLDQTVIKLDPWSPVISCSAFAVLVLALGCFYISRQDF